MQLRRVGIWGNTAKPAVGPLARDLISWLESKGREVVLARPLAEVLGGPVSAVEEEALPGAVDLVVSLGGDGSLLHSARLVGGAGVPILGVNLGRLGFLAEVPPDGMIEAMEKVLEGQFQVEERMNLAAALHRNGRRVAEFRALNDVVVDRGASPRVLQFEIVVHGAQVTTYTGDGLIVATPTGSTGHSLSAGGPVVNPRTRLVIVTPMCPHTLAARTIIISDTERLEASVHSAGHEAQLAVDGQVGITVQSGDRLTVEAASTVTRLVRLNHTSFYEILRTKFQWGTPRLDDPR